MLFHLFVFEFDPHDWRSKERRKEKIVRARRKKGALHVLANRIDHEKFVPEHERQANTKLMVTNQTINHYRY